MSQGSDALGDRPNPIEPQGIDGQAAQRGQDLNAVVFPVRWTFSRSGTSRTQCQLFSIDQRCWTDLSRALAPVRRLVT
jgi:hypothetical protein